MIEDRLLIRASGRSGSPDLQAGLIDCAITGLGNLSPQAITDDSRDLASADEDDGDSCCSQYSCQDEEYMLQRLYTYHEWQSMPRRPSLPPGLPKPPMPSRATSQPALQAMTVAAEDDDLDAEWDAWYSRGVASGTFASSSSWAQEAAEQADRGRAQAPVAPAEPLPQQPCAPAELCPAATTTDDDLDAEWDAFFSRGVASGTFASLASLMREEQAEQDHQAQAPAAAAAPQPQPQPQQPCAAAAAECCAFAGASLVAADALGAAAASGGGAHAALLSAVQRGSGGATLAVDVRCCGGAGAGALPSPTCTSSSDDDDECDAAPDTASVASCCGGGRGRRSASSDSLRSWDTMGTSSFGEDGLEDLTDADAEDAEDGDALCEGEGEDRAMLMQCGAARCCSLDEPATCVARRQVAPCGADGGCVAAAAACDAALPTFNVAHWEQQVEALALMCAAHRCELQAPPLTAAACAAPASWDALGGVCAAWLEEPHVRRMFDAVVACALWDGDGEEGEGRVGVGLVVGVC